MQIDFAPGLAQPALTVLPVEKDGLERVVWGAIDAGGQALAHAAAAAGRFEGEAGAIAELFLPGEPVRRLLLLGVGAGGEADWEKAGGALTARLLTSGVTEASVDLSALAGAPTAKAVARFAATADQRAWRWDVYRTKLADKAKPTPDPHRHRRRAGGHRRRMDRAGRPDAGHGADPHPGHRAAQHPLSRDLRRAGDEERRGRGPDPHRPRRGGDGVSLAWARCSA